MNSVNAAVAMCLGSMLISQFVMVVSLTFAYVARRWIHGISELARA